MFLVALVVLLLPVLLCSKDTRRRLSVVRACRPLWPSAPPPASTNRELARLRNCTGPLQRLCCMLPAAAAPHSYGAAAGDLVLLGAMPGTEPRIRRKHISNEQRTARPRSRL